MGYLFGTAFSLLPQNEIVSTASVSTASAGRVGILAASPNPPPKETGKISTPGQYPGQRTASACGSSPIVGVYARMAKLIITCALIPVRKDFISFIDLFELGLGLFITGIRNPGDTFANFRYAFLISSSEAFFGTPITS